MAKAKPIDVELVRALLEYAPELGGSCLRWKVSIGAMMVGSRAGTEHPNGYVYVKIQGKRYMAHRLVWVVVMGQEPTCQVDHVNGQRNDNRICNLRLARNNASDNNQNRRRQKNNTSGYVGVVKEGNKWKGQIWVDHKQIYLGGFDTPEEAYAAYLEAKAKLHTFNPIQR